jgi:calcineurin-like phosphoesterase family protein
MFDWVISDTHFFHDNIVKYAGRPENHTDLMIANWNDTVVDTYDQVDTVLHLGDILMGKRDLWPLIDLPGAVTALVGNHDEDHKQKYIRTMWGWEFVPEFQVRYRGWEVYFSHKPLWVDYPDPDDNTEVVVNRESLKHAGNRSLNVHGHIHEKPAPSIYHINVSVEQIGYKPVNLTELLDNKIDSLA